MSTSLSNSSLPLTSSLSLAFRALLPSDERALEWHGGVDRRSFYQAQTHAHQTGEITVLIAAGEFEEQKNFPLGQAAIHWNGKPTHPEIPDIQSLRVHPSLRGRGIGSRLLEVCEKHVAKQDYKRVSLSVALDNPDAQRLYERLGYRVTGAPYCDVWFFADAAGKNVRMEETVLDLIKQLD